MFLLNTNYIVTVCYIVTVLRLIIYYDNTRTCY